MNDELDHAFLPYIADRELRALLIEITVRIAEEHGARNLEAESGHRAGITSPTATNPREGT